MKIATEQYCTECCPIHYFTRLGFGKHFLIILNQSIGRKLNQVNLQ